MKQLNLPFSEANFDSEPLPDNVSIDLKELKLITIKKLMEEYPSLRMNTLI